MKKPFLILTVFLLLVAGALFAQEMTLNEVIIRSARGVEEALPQGTMIAVLNFASPSPAFSEYVIEELTGELVNGRKLTIVDRSSLSLIREEMNLQMSGDVSDESAQAIGKMLGAQSIVSGNLTNMGTFQRFRVRVISVETAAIQTQVSLNLQNDAQVVFLLGDNATSAASSSRQGPAGSNQSGSSQDEDAWKNKWIYLGGGLGLSKATWSWSSYWGDQEDSGYLLTPFFTANFAFTNFFALGLSLGAGIAFYGGGWPVVPIVPILAKIGGKFGQVELTGNIGYTVSFGLSLGATFGYHIGPGILFTELVAVPWVSSFIDDNIFDSSMLITIGYKAGVGKNRR
jgi:TolB-like protein